MNSITKERIELFIKNPLENGLTRGEQMELARIALASLEAAEKRIAELEAKLDSADKLQDSAFRHGLQHGFSLGQTDNQAGFEECLSAYGTGKGE
jgi:hypothetical protein